MNTNKRNLSPNRNVEPLESLNNYEFDVEKVPDSPDVKADELLLYNKINNYESNSAFIDMPILELKSSGRSFLNQSFDSKNDSYYHDVSMTSHNEIINLDSPRFIGKNNNNTYNLESGSLLGVRELSIGLKQFHYENFIVDHYDPKKCQEEIKEIKENVAYQAVTLRSEVKYDQFLFIKMNEDMKYGITLTQEKFNRFKKKIDFKNLNKFIAELNDCFTQNCENDIIIKERKSTVIFNITLLMIAIVIASALMFLVSAILQFKETKDFLRLLVVILINFAAVFVSIQLLNKVKKLFEKNKYMFRQSIELKDKFKSIVDRWQNLYFNKFRTYINFQMGFKAIIISFGKPVKFDFDMEVVLDMKSNPLSED